MFTIDTTAEITGMKIAASMSSMLCAFIAVMNPFRANQSCSETDVHLQSGLIRNQSGELLRP